MPGRVVLALASVASAALLLSMAGIAGCEKAVDPAEPQAQLPSLAGRLSVKSSAEFSLSGEVGGVRLTESPCTLAFFEDSSFLLAGTTVAGDAIVSTGSYSDHAGRRHLTGSALTVGRSRVEAPWGAAALDGSRFALGPVEGVRASEVSQGRSFIGARLYRYASKEAGRYAPEAHPDDTARGTAYGVFTDAGQFLLVAIADSDGEVLVARGRHTKRTDGQPFLDLHGGASTLTGSRLAIGQGSFSPDLSSLALTADFSDGARTAAVFQAGLARTPSPPDAIP